MRSPRTRGCGPSGWERESTASQLADLARLAELGGARKGAPVSQFAGSDAAELLQGLGDPDALIRRAYLGKFGLALSGGGFRASLFHIGVLARLAENDELRRVEVLSCVSGGSIVGAHYYLEIRHLLQKADDEIDAEGLHRRGAAAGRGFSRGRPAQPARPGAGHGSATAQMAVARDPRTEPWATSSRAALRAVEGRPRRRVADTDLIVRPLGEREGFHPRTTTGARGPRCRSWS